MVENVRESFLKNLDDIDWMDSETKAKAEEKANLIRKMIAYPDYIVNNKVTCSFQLNLKRDKHSFD